MIGTHCDICGAKYHHREDVVWVPICGAYPRCDECAVAHWRECEPCRRYFHQPVSELAMQCVTRNGWAGIYAPPLAPAEVPATVAAPGDGSQLTLF